MIIAFLINLALNLIVTPNGCPVLLRPGFTYTCTTTVYPVTTHKIR